MKRFYLLFISLGHFLLCFLPGISSYPDLNFPLFITNSLKYALLCACIFVINFVLKRTTDKTREHLIFYFIGQGFIGIVSYLTTFNIALLLENLIKFSIFYMVFILLIYVINGLPKRKEIKD